MITNFYVPFFWHLATFKKYSSPHLLIGHLRVTHIAKGSKERLGKKEKRKKPTNELFWF